MQDRQLYEQVLGIHSPWYVERVELKLDKGKGALRVYLDHQQAQTWRCAECGKDCAFWGLALTLNARVRPVIFGSSAAMKGK